MYEKLESSNSENFRSSVVYKKKSHFVYANVNYVTEDRSDQRLAIGLEAQKGVFTNVGPGDATAKALGY